MANEELRYRVKVFRYSDATADELVPPLVASAWLPKNVDVSVGSRWGQPFQQSSGFFQYLADAGSHYLGKATGADITGFSRHLSVQVWTGTSPLKMTLPLEFIAREPNSSREDVITPVLGLMELATPTLTKHGEFLRAPGPSPAGLEGGENIIIAIGDFVTFKNIIVTDASVTWSGRMLRDGNPASAKVRLSFSTQNIIDRASMYNMFNEDVPANVGYNPSRGSALRAGVSPGGSLLDPNPNIDVDEEINNALNAASTDPRSPLFTGRRGG